MSAIAKTFVDNRNLLISSIALGGLVTGILHLLSEFIF